MHTYKQRLLLFFTNRFHFLFLSNNYPNVLLNRLKPLWTISTLLLFSVTISGLISWSKRSAELSFKFEDSDWILLELLFLFIWEKIFFWNQLLIQLKKLLTFLKNKKVSLTVRGYEAIVFQHEQAHLEGKLFYHHINKKNPWHSNE